MKMEKLDYKETKDFYMLKFQPSATKVMLVPGIVLRLLEEQDNTISKVKLNKIGFRVLVYGFKKYISKEEIDIHNIIHNWIIQVG